MKFNSAFLMWVEFIMNVMTEKRYKKKKKNNRKNNIKIEDNEQFLKVNFGFVFFSCL